MALVQVPRIRLEKTPDQTIKNLQIALERFRLGFDNAAANAINPSDVNSPTDGPSTGGGGAGALDIIEQPTNVALVTGSELNETNHTREAFVDVTFNKPPNAVGVEIYYRQQGETNFRQTYANQSPYRLLHLLPGINYDIQLAGEAANGAIGPKSQTQSVTTPGEATGDNSEVATTTTHYVVTETSSNLTNEHILRGEQDVVSIVTPENVARVEITPLGITTNKLGPLAVTTPKLADAAVTTIKINDLAVTTGKLADLAVTEAKLADNTVTNIKLADMQAVSVKVRNVLSLGDPVDLQATINDTVLARLTTTLEWSKVTNAMLDTNSVNNTNLVDNSVSETKLQSSSVTSSKIADSQITTAKIADSQVTGPKLAASSVDSTHLTANSVNTTNLVDLAVTGGKIADNTITQAKLQSGSVGAVQIQSNSVGDLELRDSVGHSVIGRSINTTGNPGDIVATATNQLLWFNGTIIGFAAFNIDRLAVGTTQTFIITATGLTTTVTATARYMVAGNCVWLHIPFMTGTSNATTFTLTGLPAAITPAQTWSTLVQGTNAGTACICVVQLVAASTTINLFVGPGNTAWTNTGTKQFGSAFLTYALL